MIPPAPQETFTWHGIMVYCLSLGIKINNEIDIDL